MFWSLQHVQRGCLEVKLRVEGCNIFCTMAVIVVVVCSMITNCSVLTGVMDKPFHSASWQKV